MAFDPIQFLDLNSLDSDTLAQIIPKINNDLAEFLMAKFTEKLDENDLDYLESMLPILKNPEDVANTISHIHPDYSESLLIYLEEFKTYFLLENYLSHE